MVGSAVKAGITVEEYLTFERASATKHELHDGQLFAMAGAKRRHNLIVGNVVTRLNIALSDRPCEVYPSDMRLRINKTERYVYPDASAVCEEPVFDDDNEDTLINPQLIVEVLSASTEAYDRGKKFERYRSIPSFSDYLLLSQLRPMAEHFVRQSDGSWNLRVLRAGDELHIEALGFTLSVDDLYHKVRFGHASATS